MHKAGPFYLGALVLAALGAAACGGDGGGTGGSGNAGGSGGHGGSTTGPKLTCDDYCAEVMANCTDTHQQYADLASCMGSCAGFPAGALTDTAGNTLGCRLYHGGAAAETDPTTHCPHAGPSGGDKDPTDAAGGPCGEACESFCEIALVACAGQPSAYQDTNECMTECKTFAASPADLNANDTAETTADDYNCRLYHLTVASSSAANATTHCPHIRASSPVCTM